MQRKTIEQSELTLAGLLRQMRKDAGKYQSEIAELLKVKSVTYSAYENGRIVPSADKLYTLAKYYGVSAEVFLSKLDPDATNDAVKGSELQKVKDDAGQVDELVYYFKNLTDSQKKAVYDLTKTLYMD
ncbi:helix-turn-helix domain-containing protein [Butyrivibrio sp. YAB3001]|uniref:helix-turn-helix domain-containing protein n=1 Tax=Butyrivibrio sp. YAB3001 TaxID=1520812 RepID=UPI0008F62713|nr:helix-turn-helix transcriptional regulator [Butyrivibrio sp. YAB3001]SFC26505.1 Helix-turn-helix domain-containing protein [Butyrivibrio sp. YAB3001]